MPLVVPGAPEKPHVQPREVEEVPTGVRTDVPVWQVPTRVMNPRIPESLGAPLAGSKDGLVLPEAGEVDGRRAAILDFPPRWPATSHASPGRARRRHRAPVEAP